MSKSVSTLPSKKAAIFFKRHSIWISLAILFGVLPLVFKSSFAMPLLNQIYISIILALSFNMLFGQCGLLTFSHAIYFGLGGFVAIHAMRIIGTGAISFPLFMLPLIGGAAGLFFGLIFGSVSVKSAGIPFALITIGIGELVHAIAQVPNPFFGGEQGIRGDRTAGPQLLGITFGPQIEVYYLIAAWTLLSIVLMYAFSRTPVGRLSNAVRDNPERAQFVGYNPQRVRFIVFSLAGFFAGIAGGLYAINYEIFTSDNLTIIKSSDIISMAFLGGIRHFWGPILGGIILTLMFSVLSDYSAAWFFYVGIFFVIFVLYAPGGLASLLMMHLPVLKAHRLHKLMPVYLRALVPGVILAAGVIGLIEISYLSFASVVSTEMNLWGIHFDAKTPWPWIFSIALAGIGFYFLRRMLPIVASRWGDINREINERQER